MDVTPILNSIFESIWYLIPLMIFIGVLKSPWFKGIFGEFQVNLLLSNFLPKDHYCLIKNVTLPTKDGSTQIDHIVVSVYGIFVVETKNMKGWIFGKKNQKQWTQKIYKHTSKFQNPLHQNYKHTKTLVDLLDVEDGSVFSVIIFIGGSQFKTDMPSNVTHSFGGIKYIKSKKDVKYTNEQMVDVINKIQSGRLKPGLKTNLAHVAHVKEIINEK